MFREHTFCTMGRSQDCMLRLPGDGDGRMVSRRHCQLEIDPPRIEVRDLNSLNGTFVNGNMIGRRRQDPCAECSSSSAYPLHSGDSLQVGTNVFRVDIVTEPSTNDRPADCAAHDCGGAAQPDGLRRAVEADPCCLDCANPHSSVRLHTSLAQNYPYF
jgi:predicted component of type VI protein secretion system